ncbi:S8 family serine peptidase [Glaciimonas sp. PAMC28666]|uniref:S8 family serine peptidase n=1 Tax=Glaciimonas sp. PAMC28666 TaxID=2807626 RepID=UPI001964871E|nr:S8 family serine peptidase [Glaciimonas sp. PAMC28666]QRX84513.1 S8 family serine peptidase [Glaciimonas sp. PAMC28666]
MKPTLTKLLLCATIGALFSLPLQAKEAQSTSITVLLRSTLSALESNQQLPENTAAALAQLEQTALRLEPIFPAPMTYSKDDIAAMERHNLTRYYTIDTSNKSPAAVQEMLTELKTNALVESVQITPVIVKQDELISVVRSEKKNTGKILGERSDFPDYTSLQHYKHSATPEAGYELGGLNSIAARSYAGGDGEYARVISTEWSHWSYDHVDLPRPFLIHGETDYRTPDDHDTASAGIMFSKDNGFGTTGFVPKAQAGYSKFSQPGEGSLFSLAQHLQPGDVVQVGIQFWPPALPPEVCDKPDTSHCYLPVESVHSVADEIAYLTEEKGVHVVIAAANGNVNLDHPFFEGQYDRNKFDSGAIYAGGADPASGTKAGYSEYGSRVDLFSWGWNVTTTFCDGVDCADDTYTNEFGGTSSANPIIAGAVAQIQSIAFANGLGAIPPKKMRKLLVETGHPLPFPDAARPIGMQPDVVAVVERLFDESKPPIPPEAIVGTDIDNAVGPTRGGVAFPLDGSQSKGAVKYVWKQMSGSARLIDSDKPIASVLASKNDIGENTYQLTVTNKSGDQSSAVIKVTIVAPAVTIAGATSIAEGESASLKAQANFNGPYSWKVLDAAGNEVLQGKEQELNLSGLAIGLYQITVIAGSQTAQREASAQQNLMVKEREGVKPPVVTPY